MTATAVNFQHFLLLFAFSSIIYCYFLPGQFEPYPFASVEGNDSFFPFPSLSEFVFKTELTSEPTLQVPLQELACTCVVFTAAGGGGGILVLAFLLGEAHCSWK